MSDAAILLTAVALLISSVATLIVAMKGLREVRTGNELRIGQLSAATETRRVEAIGHDDRTAQEQRHVDDAPTVGPAQGPDMRGT